MYIIRDQKRGAETMEKSGVLCYTQTGPPGRDRTGAEGGGEGSSEISVPGPPHYYSGT